MSLDFLPRPLLANNLLEDFDPTVYREIIAVELSEDTNPKEVLLQQYEAFGRFLIFPIVVEYEKRFYEIMISHALHKYNRLSDQGWHYTWAADAILGRNGTCRELLERVFLHLGFKNRDQVIVYSASGMNYLGEFPITVEKTPTEWALYLIEQYGGCDGGHHKTWVLDQVARVLQGAPVTTVEARWTSGEKDLRVTVGTSPQYELWVKSFEDNDYSYDTGTPP